MLDDLEGPARAILKLFISEPQSKFIKLLSGLIDRWIDFAAYTFPKSAAGLSGGELLFQEKRRERKSDFVKNKMCNGSLAVARLVGSRVRARLVGARPMVGTSLGQGGRGGQISSSE